MTYEPKSSPELLAVADRIIDDAARSGFPFSANDLRQKFVDAGVPGAVRGSRIRHAWKNRSVIEPVSEVTTTDPGTNGKRIFMYRGVRR